MAIKNQETGKYECRLYINATHKEIIGEGDTKEAAIKDAKAKKQDYMANPLVETACEIKSPGNEFYKQNDMWIPEYKSDRKIKTLARPDLLDTIKENLNKNK